MTAKDPDLEQRVRTALKGAGIEIGEERSQKPRFTEVANIVYPVIAEYIHEKGIVFGSLLGESLPLFFEFCSGSSQVVQSIRKTTDILGENFGINYCTLKEGLDRYIGQGDKISTKRKLNSLLFYSSEERLRTYLMEHAKVTEVRTIVIECTF